MKQITQLGGLLQQVQSCMKNINRLPLTTDNIISKIYLLKTAHNIIYNISYNYGIVLHPTFRTYYCSWMILNLICPVEEIQLNYLSLNRKYFLKKIGIKNKYYFIYTKTGSRRGAIGVERDPESRPKAARQIFQAQVVEAGGSESLCGQAIQDRKRWGIIWSKKIGVA